MQQTRDQYSVGDMLAAQHALHLYMIFRKGGSRQAVLADAYAHSNEGAALVPRGR